MYFMFPLLCSATISRNGARNVGIHKIQDHAYGSLISAAGVDHGMVNRAIRPFHVEVFFDKVRALTIYGIDQILGFLLSFSACHQSADFIFSWRKQEDTQCPRIVLQKLLRTSA